MRYDIHIYKVVGAKNQFERLETKLNNYLHFKKDEQKTLRRMRYLNGGSENSEYSITPFVLRNGLTVDVGKEKRIGSLQITVYGSIELDDKIQEGIGILKKMHSFDGGGKQPINALVVEEPSIQVRIEAEREKGEKAFRLLQ